MPNHTSNILTVKGPQEDVDKFIEENKNEESNLTFEKSLPTPPESLQSSKIKNGVMPDWYSWRVDNWGTKWDCYDVGAWANNTIHYYTAWSPATAFFANVSEKYPTLTFRHKFADEGGGFVGEETISQGEVHSIREYKWDSKEGVEARDELGYYHPEDEEDQELLGK